MLSNSCPGSDKLTYVLYKEFSHLLIPLLTAAFNAALEASEFPSILVYKYIALIYKKGVASDIANYYFISVEICFILLVNLLMSFSILRHFSLAHP
jgi:hypothetical protein